MLIWFEKKIKKWKEDLILWGHRLQCVWLFHHYEKLTPVCDFIHFERNWFLKKWSSTNLIWKKIQKLKEVWTVNQFVNLPKESDDLSTVWKQLMNELGDGYRRKRVWFHTFIYSNQLWIDNEQFVLLRISAFLQEIIGYADELITDKFSILWFSPQTERKLIKNRNFYLNFIWNESRLKIAKLMKIIQQVFVQRKLHSISRLECRTSFDALCVCFVGIFFRWRRFKECFYFFLFEMFTSCRNKPKKNQFIVHEITTNWMFTHCWLNLGIIKIKIWKKRSQHTHHTQNEIKIIKTGL